MAEPGERTAQEREAARRERERRRAGTTGEPESGAPSSPADSRELESAADPAAARWEDAEPSADDESYVNDDADDESYVNDEPYSDPDGYVDDEPYAVPTGDAGDHDGSDRSAHEVPSGTRRISALHARPAHRRSRPARPRRTPAAARPGGPWKGRIASLIALVVAAVLIWFLIELFQPFGTSPHGRVTVVIPDHSSAGDIGDLLERQGVISSSFFFGLRADLAGERSKLRAGTYHLQRDMSYGSVLAKLTTAPPAPKTTNLTITEGRTRAYVNTLLRQQQVKGDYLAQTRHSPLLDPTHYGAPRNTPSLEGFLFPDTFTLVEPVRVSALVADQLRDFRRRFAHVNLSYAKRHGLTAYDVLKIASLIEGEAGTTHDERLVASVIYNRLHDNMPLQLDATTRYATGNFTQPLTASQLQSPSPYNTRVHTGLPPTPINSPGVSAIDAAAQPAVTRYLYFFAKPCSQHSVFATSYTGFLNLLQSDKRTHC